MSKYCCSQLWVLHQTEHLHPDTKADNGYFQWTSFNVTSNRIIKFILLPVVVVQTLMGSQCGWYLIHKSNPGTAGPVGALPCPISALGVNNLGDYPEEAINVPLCLKGGQQQSGEGRGGSRRVIKPLFNRHPSNLGGAFYLTPPRYPVVPLIASRPLPYPSECGVTGAWDLPPLFACQWTSAVSPLSTAPTRQALTAVSVTIAGYSPSWQQRKREERIIQSPHPFHVSHLNRRKRMVEIPVPLRRSPVCALFDFLVDDQSRSCDPQRSPEYPWEGRGMRDLEGRGY